MVYMIDLPYEIHTCQECPFKHTDKGSTKCIFARNGEKLSIRGGSCPIQWHTGEPFWVCFRNGYSPDSPTFEAKVTFSTGYGVEQWGAEKNKRYIVLRILEIRQ